MPRAAFTSAVFDAFLRQGLWHVTVDDNVTGECLTSDLIRQIVTRYRAQPGDAGAVQDMGLFALAMGVAEWGVIDPAGLPADPAGKRWKSDTGPDSGKHLMSYGIGGIGISHADVGDLEEFIRDVAEDRTVVPAEHAPALLRLADRDLYKPRNGRRAVIYDEIRAAGICASQKFDIDLLGEPFRHFDNLGAGSSYCAKHLNRNLNATDWRVFRTWMRAAIRTKAKQEWLASLWLRDYWDVSLVKIPQGPGFIEEALVNVRVRNSSPRHADRAMDQPAATIAERVQRELDEYGRFNMSTLQRRCRLMLRPVVLFRHFAGESPLQGITCPPGSA
jgi:hypothetical protein